MNADRGGYPRRSFTSADQRCHATLAAATGLVAATAYCCYVPLLAVAVV